LQTSSVQAFNEVFSHLQRNIEVVETLSAGKATPTYPPIENMLQIAQKMYLDLRSTSKWSGLTTKANQSGFVAQPTKGKKGDGKKLTCWNCVGTGHGLKACTKPVNQTAIEQRKKAFTENRKNSQNGNQGGNKGKWSEPTESEKGRRVINGKPMFYKRNTKRWEIDKKALPPLTTPTANPAVSAQPTVPAPTPQVPMNPVQGSNDASKAGKELAMSNYTHQINLAMQGLTNVMRDS
jgi:hypothetical protein